MNTQGAPLRWAVLGVGTAGRARARAISADRRSQLVAVHRGRYAADLEAPELPLDEAIGAADAVAVCSPSRFHADQVRRVLEAGKHAVVEFPLAEQPDTAADLLELARRVGRVLHVEHIELLDPAQVTLGAQVRPELLRAIEITFDRPGDALVDPAELALGNVARIHRVVHVGGPVASVAEVSLGAGTLEGRLTLRSGVEVSFRFAQGPHRARQTRMLVDGTIARWLMEDRTLYRDEMPQTLLSSRSLFEQDHLVATARILDGRGPYVPDDRVVHVLDVAAALAALRTGPVPERPAR